MNSGLPIGITLPHRLSPHTPPVDGLIRVHRLSSLCAGLARFFALTPSPSPTAWERGGSAFPLCRCGRGGQS